jgi:hypothetical protein
MTTDKATIKTLAVAYEAFCDANRLGDLSGKRVWGEMLKETQDKLGIVLLTLDDSYLSFLKESRP